ncbi:tyrosine-type recombinase/integrase [Desulfofustis glycolicus]|uniref:Site-specific recombinase XerD n=1 Tax=Desulfofustis glycolicus DSM 9705 TaxID=1121409 RepID=A0A1M5RUW1_9BACT|nr:tyrosine-type recombinase/integrase [Desulfofustis glycolicus]SHH29970.1 Site-specific recombinase XerD [Desulfofustis glycolicus DSM 9705]
MSFIDGGTGKRLFEKYLKKYHGGSQRVYRSEIKQFFDFKNSSLEHVKIELLRQYQEKLAEEHTPATTKRKFSILNGFFKFIEGQVKGFSNPISKLGDFKTHRGIKSDEFKKMLALFIAEQNTLNTKRSYENQVKLFFSWAGKDLAEITRSEVATYRDYLRMERMCKDSTIWNKFIALNRFFKFVERENRKFKNPIVFKELKLIFPKKDKGYYSVLSTVEAEKLLRAVDKRTAIGKRDYAMLLITLVYGLRANEIARLQHNNLELERVKGQQKVWVIDRKGRFQNRPKTAIILNGRALRAFDDWLETVKNHGVRCSGGMPIFLPFIYDRNDGEFVIKRSRNYRPLSVKAVENIVKKYLQKASISREQKTLSPHALRHTAFTLLARAGVKLHDIQKLAGHQDINTTMIYVHSAQSYKDHPGMHSPLNK